MIEQHLQPLPINPHHQHQSAKQNVNQTATIPAEYNTSMDQYEHHLYNNHSHYNATGVIHPSINHDYNDLNYYNNYYTYDDQLRPYSVSSNSCSSSNSDGDTQMNSMHQHHSHHPHQQQQQNNQSSILTSQANNTRINSGGIVDPNSSPTEYSACMNRPTNTTFELNCFSGIGNVVDNVIATHQLHEHVHPDYMNEYGKNHIGIGDHQLSIDHGANNGNSGGVLLSTGDIVNTNNIADTIQYTSVIVEPTNFHITNEYVH